RVRNLSGGYRTWCQFHPEDHATGCTTPTGDGYSATNSAKGAPGGASVGASAGASCCGGGGEAAKSTSTGDQSVRSAPNTTMQVDEKLDVRGQCCPGPIVALADALNRLETGRVLEVRASDSGFLSDVPAWCRNTGNELLASERENGHFVARIRKSVPVVATGPAPAAGVSAAVRNNKTIVVFSSDLDKVMAALIIANGAAAMGQKVTLFFTFWGLSALRRSVAPPVSKPFMARMFGWMLPRGAARLPLSRMHMGGMGKAMMTRVMRSHNVAPIAALLAQAQAQGVKLVACSMSLDVLGLKPEELLDGVEVAGVAAYLAEADNASANLFV
ncbi:MAG TPA: DsrE/DsrF/DrsH-like family protein, partial [Phycisphaerae bacterium]|nr:DsrE/DsrF/DrsH-like family protein [Phycisphaerae bacterium]